MKLFQSLKSKIKTLLTPNIKEIKTIQAPKAIGPYSQGVKAGHFAFISGQLSMDLNGILIGKDVKEQTIQSIKNIEAILKAEGLTLANVVNTTVYLKDFNDFSAMNEIYQKEFELAKGTFPARATIEVSRLPKDALVEISCIAHKA